MLVLKLGRLEGERRETEAGEEAATESSPLWMQQGIRKAKEPVPLTLTA